MAVLSEDQIMLRDMAAAWVRDRQPVSARRAVFEGHFDRGYDPTVYAEMAEMGWTGIVVPEAWGGLDFGYLSLGLVIEELGRTLVASPFVSSALAAASALRLGGTDAQRDRWLRGIADGSVIGALAVDEGVRHAPATLGVRAEAVPGGWRIQGEKRPVPDGMAADVAIVAAASAGGTMLFAVDLAAEGVTRRALDQIDARRPAMITFDIVVGEDAVLGAAGESAALLDAILDRVRAGVAAEMLGMATQAFETTLDYLKTRVQFGQIIGSFQALQHRASEMFGELQLTRSAVEAALAAIDADDPDLPKLASLAKALAGDTLHRISNEMVQMHGGIGMTHEHDAGLYLKSARVADQSYGNAAYHRERWGRLSGY